MLAWCDGEQLGRRRVQHPPQVLPPVSSPFLVHPPLSCYLPFALVGFCGRTSFGPRQRLVQRCKPRPPLTGARSSSWSVTDLHSAHYGDHARTECSARRSARYARRLVRQQLEHDGLYPIVGASLFTLRSTQPDAARSSRTGYRKTFRCFSSAATEVRVQQHVARASRGCLSRLSSADGRSFRVSDYPLLSMRFLLSMLF